MEKLNFALAGAFLGGIATAVVAEERPPNILFILSDDQGFAEWMADLPDPLVFANSQFDVLRQVR